MKWNTSECTATAAETAVERTEKSIINFIFDLFAGWCFLPCCKRTKEEEKSCSIQLTCTWIGRVRVHRARCDKMKLWNGPIVEFALLFGIHNPHAHTLSAWRKRKRNINAMNWSYHIFSSCSLSTAHECWALNIAIGILIYKFYSIRINYIVQMAANQQWYFSQAFNLCILLSLFAFELSTIHSHMNGINATQVSRNHFVFILFSYSFSILPSVRYVRRERLSLYALKIIDFMRWREIACCFHSSVAADIARKQRWSAICVDHLQYSKEAIVSFWLAFP